jgi:hypothetical protein
MIRHLSSNFMYNGEREKIFPIIAHKEPV